MIKLGVVQESGDILLYDENIKFREEMTGRYRRVRQSLPKRLWLGKQGYQHVTSSFISGIAERDADLWIRFHNGSVYRYMGFGRLFDDMMQANSKGQYFNRNIRPTRHYKKEANLPYRKDIEMEDEGMFESMDFDYIRKIARGLSGAEIMVGTKIIEGVEYTQYKIGEIVFYRPKKSIN